MPVAEEERIHHLAPAPLPRPPLPRRKRLPLIISLPLQALSLIVVLVVFLISHDARKHPAPVLNPERDDQVSFYPPSPDATPRILADTRILPSAGRIYLVPLGPHVLPYNLNEIAQWLRDRHGLNIQILPPASLNPSTFDPQRRQYISELLLDQLKRDHPLLAANPSAFLLGVTDQEMYAPSLDWGSTYSTRDLNRATVISVADFDKDVQRRDRPRVDAVPLRVRARVRRSLLRNLALLYWHLPYNNDPNSLLYRFRSPWAPGRDLTNADLHPERTPSGENIADPCITFTFAGASLASPAAAPGPLPPNPIQECAALDALPPDLQRETVQLHLATGLLVDRHTDFYLPGPIPLLFERSITDQWRFPAAFGISGTHNYDQYLGTWDDMRHISVANPVVTNEPMQRFPVWLPFLAFNKWTDTASGKMLQLRWKSGSVEHFDLQRYTGLVESYMPCERQQMCFLDGIRNPHGDTLAFTRDPVRRLTRLASQDGRWLNLTYDAGHRVAQITDSTGRQVLYRYNPLGQLATVTFPSGEIISYTYDAQQHLLTVSAAPAPNSQPVLLLTNLYEAGHLTRQTQADGRTWTYQHGAVDSFGNTPITTVRTPDGVTLDLGYGSQDATILERQPQPSTPPTQEKVLAPKRT